MIVGECSTTKKVKTFFSLSSSLCRYLRRAGSYSPGGRRRWITRDGHACRDEGPRRSAAQAGGGAGQSSVVVGDGDSFSFARRRIPRLESRIVPRECSSGSRTGAKEGEGRNAGGAGESLLLFFSLLSPFFFDVFDHLLLPTSTSTASSTSSLSPSLTLSPFLPLSLSLSLAFSTSSPKSSRTPAPRGKSPG